MASAASSLEQRPQDDSDPAVDPIYVAQFSEHLKYVRSHLAGKDGSAPPPPSFVPPQAHWTSTEKEAFFHGLTIHSRLRPDLIANEIKTKTVVDVCVLLDVLEEGARNAAAVHRKDLPLAMEVSEPWVALEEQKAQALVLAEPGSEEKALQDKREEDVRAYKRSVRAPKIHGRIVSHDRNRDRDRESERRKRNAIKVWLDDKKEEWEMEDALSALDLPTLRAMDRVLREGAKTENAEESQIEDKQSSPLESVSVGRDIQTSAAGPSSATHSARSSPLDETLLDPVLRAQSQSVPPITSRESSPYPNSTQGSAGLSRDITAVPAHLLPHASFRPSTPPYQSAPLASKPLQALDPSTPVKKRQLMPDDPTSALSLSPAERRRLQKRLHMRKKRAEARGEVVVQSLDKLKPGRKRKRQKTARGDPSLSAVERRTPELTQVATPGTAKYYNGFNGELHNEADPISNVRGEQPPESDGETRHPHRSGTTLPYKLLTKLRATGLDAEKLHEEGLSLLHLRGLAKLMRSYNSIHDIPASIASQVSAEVIKLLYIHVAHFTTQVVHRAIVSREQERLAKIQTKAWRLGDNQYVLVANVEHALAMVKSEKLDKKAHFDRLLNELDFNMDDTNSSDEDGDSPTRVQVQARPARSRKRKRKRPFEPTDSSTSESSSSQSEDEEAEDEAEEEDVEGDEDRSQQDDNKKDESGPSSALPLHRLIFAPAICLPAPLRSRSNPAGSLDLSPYTPLPTSSVSAEPLRDEDILPDKIDADDLFAELLEEEELDKCDVLVEEIYEKGLWAKFAAPQIPSASGSAREDGYDEAQVGRKRNRDANVSDDDDITQGRYEPSSLRFRPPDLHGRVKSQIYVVDSD